MEIRRRDPAEDDGSPAGRIRAIVELHRGERGSLLPILHEVQAAFGCVAPDAVPVIAESLNLSRAEVHGVVSFYRDFHSEPPARVVVRVCRAEACQANGAEELVKHAVQRLGLAVGETSPDRSIALDEVFCLGNCALGPAMLVGDRLVGRVDAARFDDLVGRVPA
jgi:formate dehydrogenase subunit gamma